MSVKPGRNSGDIYDPTYAASIGLFKSPMGMIKCYVMTYQFHGFKFLPLARIHMDIRGVIGIGPF